MKPQGSMSYSLCLQYEVGLIWCVTFSVTSFQTSPLPSKAEALLQRANIPEMLQPCCGYVTARNASLSAVIFASG